MAIGETLRELVRTESVTGHETELADRIERRLRPLARGSLVLHRHDDCLVLGPRHPGESGRPLVLLAGHLDTVPLGEAWPPRLEGSVLHGRGAVDMKGGLAVMVHLAEELSPEEGFAERAFVFYTGEEGPAEGNSLGWLLDREDWLLRARLAILLEPTAGDLELGCNGTLHCRVTFTGVPCHSARPWTGRHPLEAALPWMETILRWPERPVEIAGVVFREVVTITELRAGVARNVVPPELVANLNFRYAPDRRPDEAESFARGLCPEERAAADLDSGLSPENAVGVSVEIVDHAAPGRVETREPLLRHLLDSTGLPRRAKQGWTDVARLTARGVPALNWGPGRPELCHRSDEAVDLLDVARCFDRMRAHLAGPGPR